MNSILLMIKKQTVYLLCIILVVCACKKEEGLSSETGNLEVTLNFPTGTGEYLYYSVYTEEQYYILYNNLGISTPIFKGLTAPDFKIKGLQKGYYGVKIYGNGNFLLKPVSIIPNKVNKISFP